MDIEIEEMSASITITDMAAMKAEIIAAVIAHILEMTRSDARRDADRKISAGASRRPNGLI
jgi:hypothetical protein